MASLEPRGDSVRVVWRLGGGRTGARQSCTFSGGSSEARESTAAVAKTLVESRNHDMTRDEVYRAVLGDGEVKDEPTPTFKQWAYEWLADREQRREIDAGTVKKYESVLRVRVLPYLGSLRLSEIDRDKMKAFTAWMSSNQVTIGRRNRRGGPTKLISASTVRQNYSIVSGCLAAAVPRWLPANPAAKVPGDRRNTMGLPKRVKFEATFLNPQEVQLILDKCLPEIRDLVYVALRTGMRRGELIALETRHVVFGRAGGATVTVRKTLKKDGTVGPPKSQESLRDITVSGETADILRRRTQGRRPSDLVFPDRRGNRWSPCTLMAWYWFRAVADASRCPKHLPPRKAPARNGQQRYWTNSEVSTCDCQGVLRQRPRLHDLRHTHASVLIAQGWHPKKIQRRLGHATYATTMEIYGHLMDLGDERELDSVEEWYARTE